MTKADRGCDLDFSTLCAHGELAGGERRPFGALTAPIFQTASYAHPAVGQSTGYDYTRCVNPTRNELEKLLSALEGAGDTLACGNGMAAVTLVMDLFAPGDHIVCTHDIYGGSVRLFRLLEEQRGVRFSFVDSSEPALVEAAVEPDTKALFVETPANPTLKITDLREMAKIAKAHSLLLVVDNTFMTPYLQKPLDLGADIVVHSGTKFLGGHNDTLAGFVCSRDEKLGERLRFLYNTTGPALAPFDSFLILRGLKTLPLRLDRQQANARGLAAWLTRQPWVRKVYYPGLPAHPGAAVNAAQARGPGAMLSFEVRDGETARRLVENTRLISYAESLGGTETLITLPVLQTHADVPPEEREKMGLGMDFLRLSLGVEDPDDLIRDLDQAARG